MKKLCATYFAHRSIFLEFDPCHLSMEGSEAQVGMIGTQRDFGQVQFNTDHHPYASLTVVEATLNVLYSLCPSMGRPPQRFAPKLGYHHSHLASVRYTNYKDAGKLVTGFREIERRAPERKFKEDLTRV